MREDKKSVQILEIEINNINKTIGELLTKENNLVGNTIKINMYKCRLSKLEQELNNRKEVIYGF